MLPEVIVIITAFLILISDLFLTGNHKGFLGKLAITGLVMALVSTLTLVSQQGEVFGGRFVIDGVTGWFKIIFLLAGIATVLLSFDRLSDKQVHPGGVPSERQLQYYGEYFTILLFTLVGMMYLISSRDIVTLYISLELATIPLFILVAWKRKDVLSGEAGLKYVILGAISSATLLYGLGILYGIGGHTSLEAIGQSVTISPAFWFAVALITAGIGFKLTLVPFHMWAADVYQGAPAPVTAYLSVASKGAGLAFMFLLFFQVFNKIIEDWNFILAILATITMTLGNVVAIVQQNIKRFMAFSSVSQAGYIIMGFLGPFAEGMSAMIFYMLAYLFTNLVVFTVIVFYANETGRVEIKDYRGLSRINPLIALAMLIGLFSLAGIPPLSGFVGKFFLFSVASKAGLHWLVAVAAINSTVSLYYYLRIVRQMYIEPHIVDATALRISPALSTTIVVTTAGTILLGIFPVFYESIVQTVNQANWLTAMR